MPTARFPLSLAALAAAALAAPPALADLLRNESATGTASVSGFASTNGEFEDLREEFDVTETTSLFPPLLLDTGEQGVQTFLLQSSGDQSTATAAGRVGAFRFDNAVSFGLNGFAGAFASQDPQVSDATAEFTVDLEYRFDVTRIVGFTLDYDFYTEADQNDNPGTALLKLTDLTRGDMLVFDDPRAVDSFSGFLQPGSFLLEASVFNEATLDSFFGSSTNVLSSAGIELTLIPEPGSAALAAAAGVLLLRRRRDRC